jgi:hypothetical protein
VKFYNYKKLLVRFLASIFSFKFLVFCPGVLSGMRLVHLLMSLSLIPRSLSELRRERLTSGEDEAEFLLYNQMNYEPL